MVLGRDVVPSWRGMKGGQRVLVPLSLVAPVSGTYTGPASPAYLSYKEEHRTWVDGLAVTMTPKG